MEQSKENVQMKLIRKVRLFFVFFSTKTLNGKQTRNVYGANTHCSSLNVCETRELKHEFIYPS
jgi:hypothetical protein